MKYLKDDNIFYQNNPAKFVSYLSEKTAVIIVSLLPNFDDTTTIGTCLGCMVGDSDNKLSCTCDETEYILELIEDNTDATEMPLIVNAGLLYDKPMVVMTHEKRIEELNTKRTELATKINELDIRRKDLKDKNDGLSKIHDELSKRVDDFAYLKEFDLSIEQFSNQLANNRADMLYSECDSRSITCESETFEFKFKGESYLIEIGSFWPDNKDRYYNYKVTGTSVDYLNEVGFAQ